MKDHERHKLVKEYLVITGKESTDEVRFIFDKVLAGEDILMNVKSGGRIVDCQITEADSVVQLKREKDITEHVVYVAQNAENIQLVMNPELMLFMNLISLSNVQNSRCKREQIIELNGYEYRKNTHNRRLDALLQLLIYKGDFKMYHHYRRISNQEDPYGELFFVVSDKGVILFDRKISYGIFSNQKHFIEYYKNVFSDMKRKCQFFGESILCEENLDFRSKDTLVLENISSETKMVYDKEAFKGYILRGNKQIKVCEEGIVRMLSEYMEQKK